MTTTTLDAEARRLIDRSGVDVYRTRLMELIDQRDAARAKEQQAKHRCDVARETHAEASTTAEWGLLNHFEARGNKTYLVRDEIGRAIGEEDQRTFDAGAKKDWIKAAATKDPEVRDAAVLLRTAEDALAEARSDIEQIDKSLRAVEAALQGSIAELAVLQITLTARSA